MKILAAIVQVAMRIYYGLVYPVRIIGGQNIPAEGGFLLCPNHISARGPHGHHDACTPKGALHGEKGAVLQLADRRAAAGGGGVPRGPGQQGGLGAIREGVKTLKAGDGLGIFPQGTRSADNEHLQMHNGTALLTQQTAGAGDSGVHRRPLPEISCDQYLHWQAAEPFRICRKAGTARPWPGLPNASIEAFGA